LLEVFVGGGLGKRHRVRKPIDGEGVSDAGCAGDVTLVASVVLKGGTDVPSVDAVGGHVAPLGRCDVNDNASARRGKW